VLETVVGNVNVHKAELLLPAAVKTHVHCAALRLLIASLVICRANESLCRPQCDYRHVLLASNAATAIKKPRVDADHITEMMLLLYLVK